MSVDVHASLSLSGRFSARGGDYAAAYKAWGQACNERGGLASEAVKIVLHDDESDPRRAIENIRSIAKAASFLLGPSHTVLADAVIEESLSQGLVVLQATHGSSSLFSRALAPGHFLCWPGCDADYAKPFIDRLKRDFGNDIETTILYTDGRIGTASCEGARQYLAEHGFATPKLVEIDGKTHVLDLANEVLAQTEFLLCCFDHMRPEEPTPNALQAIDDSGFTKDRVWLSDHPSGRDLSAPELYEGVWLRSTWMPSYPYPSSVDFCRRFAALSDAQPGFHAAGGFACGQVLEQAVASAGSMERRPLLEALSNGTFETVAGEIGFDDNGRPSSQIRTGCWQDGEFVVDI